MRSTKLNNEHGSIPKDEFESLSVCMNCDEKLIRGGCWSGHKKSVGLCSNCVPTTVDLIIDTLIDSVDHYDTKSAGDATEGFEILKRDLIKIVEERVNRKIKRGF